MAPVRAALPLQARRLFHRLPYQLLRLRPRNKHVRSNLEPESAEIGKAQHVLDRLAAGQSVQRGEQSRLQRRVDYGLRLHDMRIALNAQQGLAQHQHDVVRLP